MTTESLLESLETARKASGKTKTAFYGESGAGRNLPDNIKRGAFPSVEKIVAIADSLGISVDALLGRENKSAPCEITRNAIADKLMLLSQSQLDRLQGFLEALLSE